MKKIKLAIFDMDGLLIDTERQMWLRNEQIVLKEMGYEPDMDMLRGIMGMTFEEEEKVFKGFYGEDFDPGYYFPHLVAYNQKQVLSEGVPKRPGTDELLEYLKEKGITMAVATSTHRDNALIMLEKAGIGDYFDLVVCGDDVSRSKPNPDIYLKVAEAYPYGKEDMVIFEDAHNGARAAINAGIPLILVPDIAKVTEEDKKEAYLVINSLEEVIDYLY